MIITPRPIGNFTDTLYDLLKRPGMELPSLPI